MKNKWIALLFGIGIFGSLASGVGEDKRILVFTRNGEGYVHDNIDKSVEVLKEIGKANGFVVDATDDASVFTEKNLASYDALIFSNTNNETFETDQQKLAFQRYIQAGGRWMGIHSASGSERQWPWFWKMLGGKFKRHPPLQPFDVINIDPDHPSVKGIPGVWNWEDECYYLDHLNPDINVLLAADLRTVEDEKKNEYPGSVFGDYFPLVWYHEFDGGKQWYTALGHKAEYYDDPVFQKHLTGGLRWLTKDSLKLNYNKATEKLIIN